MKPIVVSNMIFWNLDYSVGKGGSNNNVAADVTFLQWAFTLWAQAPSSSAERKRLYANVRVTGACRGTDDDPLVQAIRIYQAEVLGHRHPDGRCSVSNATGRYSSQLYTIIDIGCGTSNIFPMLWPRIDLVAGCPSNVASQIRKGCLFQSRLGAQVA